ncbi:MAG TPA: phosphomethylpyrimidine synthase ThiC [Deltaproteobacteria bacterium]|nr:phosphomethylpyrimidine synthase ThiC [Deltaproteobacteria bacterium]
MTQLQSARQGIITPEMVRVARYEGLDPETVRRKVAQGTAVIPKNRLRDFEQIRGVGEGFRTKVNANIGASPLSMDVSGELNKLRAVLRHGADAVMDLSLGREIPRIRAEVLASSTVMVGTVPIYETAYELSCRGGDITDMTMEDFLATVRRQAEDGVDFMTIHAGVTRHALSAMDAQGRTLDVVSRGGSMLVAWMRWHRRESPLYEHFDEVLDILADYDVTISLGDGMRPGSTVDATDRAQITELVTLGELASRARDRGVQVIVEGPGHVPLDMIEENIRMEKDLCRGAPFYVLGPLVTDCAAGYDHIAGAIGGALAAFFGADFLCYVTPAEHLRLPDERHVVEGVIASRIAAHAADLAKGLEYARRREREMALARKELAWDRQYGLSVNPPYARMLREQSGIGAGDECTMCGEYCAIKRMRG